MVTFNAFLFDLILTMMGHYANEVPFPRYLKAMQIEYIIFPFIEYSSLFPFFYIYCLQWAVFACRLITAKIRPLCFLWNYVIIDSANLWVLQPFNIFPCDVIVLPFSFCAIKIYLEPLPRLQGYKILYWGCQWQERPRLWAFERALYSSLFLRSILFRFLSVLLLQISSLPYVFIFLVISFALTPSFASRWTPLLLLSSPLLCPLSTCF